MRWLTAAILALVPVPVAAEGADPGAALFHDGAGAEAVLMDGSLRVPADRFSCAGCHGTGAEGKREGGTVFPSLLWSDLTDPARPGGAYDEAAFLRAVTEGTGADGRPLSAVMPRFEADPQTLAALIVFLKDIERRETTGISPTAILIRVGADASEQAGYAAAAAWFNAEGGAFGRGLEIVADGEAALSAAEIDAALEGRLPDYVAAGLPPLPVSPDTNAVSTPNRIASAAHAARLQPDEFAPFLRGMLVGEAMIACGRGVTRVCLLETLQRIELARYVRIDPP
jgi:hypothetical protein